MKITKSNNKKVFVAMSGGVDSSVAAALLKQEGYDLTGVFMKNWSGDDFGLQADCPWEQDQRDVEAVCKVLDIPFMSFNFEKEYREKVVSYFFNEFKAGRTPNPDVMCNKEIKFGIFLDKSLSMGADLIATGHYARVLQNKSGEYELLKGLDGNKDQSYFLCELTQEQLSKTLFPIGHLPKPEVRNLAEQFDLPVFDKPDSQGICFVGEINVAQFLRSNIDIHTGEIVDADTGIVVGEHDGIEFYTIGQREGLNLGGASEPYFVVAKDRQNNQLLVAKGKKNPRLYNKVVHFSDLHWINKQDSIDFTKLSAVIRYRQKPDAGIFDLENNRFIFEKPQRAVAAGQLLAIYEEDILRASAVIIENK